MNDILIIAKSYLQWNDDDALFILDQHDKLHFIVLTRFKNEQSADRYVASLGHIILTPSLPVFFSYFLMLRA